MTEKQTQKTFSELDLLIRDHQEKWLKANLTKKQTQERLRELDLQIRARQEKWLEANPQFSDGNTIVGMWPTRPLPKSKSKMEKSS